MLIGVKLKICFERIPNFKEETREINLNGNNLTNKE